MGWRRLIVLFVVITIVSKLSLSLVLVVWGAQKSSRNTMESNDSYSILRKFFADFQLYIFRTWHFFVLCENVFAK